MSNNHQRGTEVSRTRDYGDQSLQRPDQHVGAHDFAQHVFSRSEKGSADRGAADSAAKERGLADQKKLTEAGILPSCSIISGGDASACVKPGTPATDTAAGAGTAPRAAAGDMTQPANDAAAGGAKDSEKRAAMQFAASGTIQNDAGVHIHNYNRKGDPVVSSDSPGQFIANLGAHFLEDSAGGEKSYGKNISETAARLDKTGKRYHVMGGMFDPTGEHIGAYAPNAHRLPYKANPGLGGPGDPTYKESIEDGAKVIRRQMSEDCKKSGAFNLIDYSGGTHASKLAAKHAPKGCAVNIYNNATPYGEKGVVPRLIYDGFGHLVSPSEQ